VTFGAAAVGGANLLPALARQRQEVAVVRSSRATLPIPALSRSDAGALQSLFFRTSRLEPRVGIQVGHWKHDEIPPELYRLRGGTGATWGPYREVDINLRIGQELQVLLEGAGITVDLLPSTVPPGYLADAILSIHADGAARVTARGWKMASPWRASAASNLLLDSVASDYGRLTGLPEDPYGITIGMKGYYAFSPHRIRHAIAPITPAVIVETGFVTVASDREVIVKQPRRVANAIATGVLRYLANRPGLFTHRHRTAYLPRTYSAVFMATASELRARPGEREPIVERLAPGTTVVPMQLGEDWSEIQVRGSFRRFGWVRTETLALPG
jgi:N-acetylmuramoyl-L-alanine amidase